MVGLTTPAPSKRLDRKAKPRLNAQHAATPPELVDDAGVLNWSALHVLRLIAALSIFTNHWAEPYASQLLPQQQLAVDLFFICEGVLVGRQLAEGGTVVRTWRPIFARALKIYPLHLVALLAGAGALAISQPGRWRGDALSAVIAHGTILAPTVRAGALGEAVFPLNPPSWAIVLELWGFAAIWRLRGRSLRTWRRLAWALIAVTMIGLDLHWADINPGWRGLHYWGGVPRMAFGFGGGVLLYELLARHARRPLWWDATGSWLAAIAMQLRPGRFIGLAFLVTLAPVVVTLTLLAIPRRWMDALGRWADRYVYGVYLLHYATLTACRAVGLKLGFEPAWLGGAAGFLGVAGVVICVAYVATRVIDEPIRRGVLRSLRWG